MFLTFLLLFLPIVLALPASDAESNFVVRDSRDTPPPGFEPVAQAFKQDDTVVKLIVVLPHGGSVSDALDDISDPNSPNFRRYFSKAQIDELVAPSNESVRVVTEWLKNNAINVEIDPAAVDTLNIQVPVSRANALLNADFKPYIHLQTHSKLIRTLSYSLPAEVHDYVSFIHPTTTFDVKSRWGESLPNTPPSEDLQEPHSKRQEETEDCTKLMSPACLQSLYKIPSAPVDPHPGNSLAVVGFNGGIPTYQDLSQFLYNLRPDHPYGVINVLPIKGGGNSTEDNAEVTLDLQYTLGLATNIPVTFLSFPLESGLQSILDLVNFLIAQEHPPLVVTASFGMDESDVSHTRPLPDYICDKFAQLGLRGVSILFSSGDGGVSGGTADRKDQSCTSFEPTFPSGCPYLTSVGSTWETNPEKAAPFTSGGFSTLFPRPSYQQAAVQKYLDGLGDKYKGMFDSSGRAFPDVSLQGVWFPIIMHGEQYKVTGTSASSPLFASMLALVNNRLLAAGKPPVGFINPMLYRQVGAGTFNDVITGNNPGCGTDGFEATEGWDPVTGVGTPDFEKLLKLLQDDNAAESQ